MLKDCAIFKATGQCGDSAVDECRRCAFNEHLCDVISDFEDAILDAKNKLLIKVEKEIVDFIKQERAQ